MHVTGWTQAPGTRVLYQHVNERPYFTCTHMHVMHVCTPSHLHRNHRFSHWGSHRHKHTNPQWQTCPPINAHTYMDSHSHAHSLVHTHTYMCPHGITPMWTISPPVCHMPHNTHVCTQLTHTSSPHMCPHMHGHTSRSGRLECLSQHPRGHRAVSRHPSGVAPVQATEGMTTAAGTASHTALTHTTTYTQTQAHTQSHTEPPLGCPPPLSRCSHVL